MKFAAYGPAALEVDEKIWQEVAIMAQKSGTQLVISDEERCLKDADVIYGDIWASMGGRKPYGRTCETPIPFRITMEMLKKQAIPMYYFYIVSHSTI